VNQLELDTTTFLGVAKKFAKKKNTASASKNGRTTSGAP
jgi:hypothetical protein